MPSLNMAAGLLVEMKNNEQYSVSRYDPQADMFKRVLLIAALSSFTFIGGCVLIKSLIS